VCEPNDDGGSNHPLIACLVVSYFFKHSQRVKPLCVLVRYFYLCCISSHFSFLCVCLLPPPTHLQPSSLLSLYYCDHIFLPSALGCVSSSVGRLAVNFSLLQFCHLPPLSFCCRVMWRDKKKWATHTQVAYAKKYEVLFYFKRKYRVTKPPGIINHPSCYVVVVVSTSLLSNNITYNLYKPPTTIPCM
jgi:hypothetical protein